MSIINKLKPAKTRKGKKFLQSREPKAIEGPKHAVFIRGASSSQQMTDLLKELYALKKPDGTLLSKKNDIKPFEQAAAQSIEFLCKKNDASQFVLTSSTKKRPNNLVIGRTFDYKLLDMIELGVENYSPLTRSSHKLPALASKPLLIFVGEQFESMEELKMLKSTLIELFGHPKNVPSVTLQGLEHVMLFTVVDETIHLRTYKMSLKKSGTRLPRAHLEDMGPNMDLKVRRFQLAPNDLMAKAMQNRLSEKKGGVRGKKQKNVKNKNQGFDEFGSRLGRIHMERQDYAKLKIKRFSAINQMYKEKRKKGKQQETNAEKSSEVIQN